MTCVSCPSGKVSWGQFIPYASMYAQGAPDEIIADAFRRATIEFAERTGVLRQTVCIDAQECVEHYCLEFDDCYTIKAVNRVCVFGREYSTLRCWEHCPPQCSYYYEHPCDLYIHPAPNCDQSDAIEVDVVLLPGQDSCFVDRIIYEEYAEDLAYGALSRLLLIPDTNWYDPRSAGLYDNKFRRSIARAKSTVARNNDFSPMHMRCPPGVFV